MEFLSFEEAKKIVRSLGLKSQEEWLAYCKAGNRPEAMPAAPQTIYKGVWSSWEDWLGEEKGKTSGSPFCSFEQARKYVRSLLFGK